MNNDVILWDPVDGRGDAVLVAGLERVEHPQHLGRVATSRGWVCQDQTDRLLGVDDEDGADGESNALGVDVGCVLVVNPARQIRTMSPQGAGKSVYSHVVGQRDLPLLIANDGELERGARKLLNVLDPSLVGLDCVCRETDELGVALGELGFKLGEGTELGGADGSVVLGVGEEDDPFVANELVKVDWPMGGLGFEVGGDAAQTERLSAVSHCDFYCFSSALGRRRREQRKQRKPEG